MAAARILNMIYSECSPEFDARFNKWYNEVHIPMLFKYPGLKRVTRYERLGDNREQARYLAVYEYDTREDLEKFHDSVEFKEAIDEMQETWKDGEFVIKGNAVYEPIMAWEK